MGWWGGSRFKLTETSYFCITILLVWSFSIYSREGEEESVLCAGKARPSSSDFVEALNFSPTLTICGLNRPIKTVSYFVYPEITKSEFPRSRYLKSLLCLVTPCNLSLINLLLLGTLPPRGPNCKESPLTHLLLRNGPESSSKNWACTVFFLESPGTMFSLAPFVSLFPKSLSFDSFAWPGFDCGVFTCMFADFLSLDRAALNFRQTHHVTLCRERIALSTLNGEATLVSCKLEQYRNKAPWYLYLVVFVWLYVSLLFPLNRNRKCGNRCGY